MPYLHKWFIARRVIFARLWGDQDVAEIARGGDELRAMMDEGTAPVYILMDDSRLGRVPNNVGQLREAVAFAGHPSLGWVVMISRGSRISNFLIELLCRLFRTRLRRVATLDDAITFVKDRDVSIDWSQADVRALTGPDAN